MSSVGVFKAFKNSVQGVEKSTCKIGDKISCHAPSLLVV